MKRNTTEHTNFIYQLMTYDIQVSSMNMHSMHDLDLAWIDQSLLLLFSYLLSVFNLYSTSLRIENSLSSESLGGPLRFYVMRDVDLFILATRRRPWPTPRRYTGVRFRPAGSGSSTVPVAMWQAAQALRLQVAPVLGGQAVQQVRVTWSVWGMQARARASASVRRSTRSTGAPAPWPARRARQPCNSGASSTPAKGGGRAGHRARLQRGTPA